MNLIVKRAIAGGAVSTVILGTATYILGEVSGYHAKELLTSSLSGINILCNTVILGGSTILALMLTLISLSRSAKTRLSNAHYSHVLTVAKSDTILIVAAVLTFLVLNLPITESEEVPQSWFSIIYYVSLTMSAILGGGFIAVITMLYGTIANVIEIVGFKKTDHPLVDSDSQNEDPNESQSKNKDREQEERVKKAEEEVKSDQ
ncbi:hypothetical protein [Salinimicrobium soli]|uniref:hypothetical protein n=1 Tax=Salinimicrobium soli TaxID=1254399 RepID=UPI003AADB2FE